MRIGIRGTDAQKSVRDVNTAMFTGRTKCMAVLRQALIAKRIWILTSRLREKGISRTKFRLIQ